MRGGPSPRLPLSPATWPLPPQWALRGFGPLPYKLPRAKPAPSHAQAWSTPQPQLQLLSVFVPQPRCLKEARAQAGSQLPLMLLPSQCGSTPGGLASQLPLPVRKTPASKASLTPRERRGLPCSPLPTPSAGRKQGLGFTPLPRQADNTLHQRSAASAFGRKALASWQPLASTWSAPGPQTASAQGAILPLAVARGPALLLPWALVSSPSRCFQGPPGSTNPSQLPPLAGRSHHCPPEPLWGPCWLFGSLKKQLADRALRALGTSP